MKALLFLLLLLQMIGCKTAIDSSQILGMQSTATCEPKILKQSSGLPITYYKLVDSGQVLYVPEIDIVDFTYGRDTDDSRTLSDPSQFIVHFSVAESRDSKREFSILENTFPQARNLFGQELYAVKIADKLSEFTPANENKVIFRTDLGQYFNVMMSASRRTDVAVNPTIRYQPTICRDARSILRPRLVNKQPFTLKVSCAQHYCSPYSPDAAELLDRSMSDYMKKSAGMNEQEKRKYLLGVLEKILTERPSPMDKMFMEHWRTSPSKIAEALVDGFFERGEVANWRMIWGDQKNLTRELYEKMKPVPIYPTIEELNQSGEELPNRYLVFTNEADRRQYDKISTNNSAVLDMAKQLENAGKAFWLTDQEHKALEEDFRRTSPVARPQTQMIYRSQYDTDADHKKFNQQYQSEYKWLPHPNCVLPEDCPKNADRSPGVCDAFCKDQNDYSTDCFDPCWQRCLALCSKPIL